MQPVSLAVVAAMSDEIRIIRSKLEVDSRVHVRPSLFEMGKYRSVPALLVQSGIGKKAMASAMKYCMERYSPKFCLHVGYCGGADPKNQAGDILIANAVVDAGTKRRFDSDLRFVDKALGICGAKKLRSSGAVLVTVDEVVPSPHEKAFVGTEHEAQGIDMESFAFAEECSGRGIPYLIARAVLDPLDTELPDMGDAIDRAGKTDAAGLAEHLIKKPKDILHLPRLGYFANEARGAITAFVDAWIEAQEAL